MSHNNAIQQQYERLGICKEVYAFGAKTEEKLKARFDALDRVTECNQLKVLRAMQQAKVSAECFQATNGYGYNDLGRDTLEAVYAACFCAEDALVRPQITCGTHALALALLSNLRPGDELLSPVGKPYDTLESVIGIRPAKGSLAEYGIAYRQVDLLPDGSFDYEKIRAAVTKRTKLATIQRSKGYATRPTLSVARIGELVAFLKSVKPDIICMVDNCYGEFVEEKEPLEVGADLIVGSLIKNPGPNRRLSRRQKRMCGECGVPFDLARARQRSRGFPRRYPVVLPGTVFSADGCKRGVKRRDFCRKHL